MPSPVEPELARRGRAWPPGVVERRPVVDEAGARVGHRRAEDEAIEVVADVVVMADRLLVASQRVSPAGQSGLLWRRRQRPADHPGPPRCGDRLDGGFGAKAQILGDRAAHRRDHRHDVAFSIEVAGDVRLEAELVWTPQQPPNGVGRLDADRARSRTISGCRPRRRYRPRTPGVQAACPEQRPVERSELASCGVPDSTCAAMPTVVARPAVSTSGRRRCRRGVAQEHRVTAVVPDGRVAVAPVALDVRVGAAAGEQRDGGPRHEDELGERVAMRSRLIGDGPVVEIDVGVAGVDEAHPLVVEVLVVIAGGVGTDLDVDGDRLLDDGQPRAARFAAHRPRPASRAASSSSAA